MKKTKGWEGTWVQILINVAAAAMALLYPYPSTDWPVAFGGFLREIFSCQELQLHKHRKPT
jgi:hypothetical protein